MLAENHWEVKWAQNYFVANSKKRKVINNFKDSSSGGWGVGGGESVMGKVLTYKWPGREESRRQPDWRHANLELTEVKVPERDLNRDL